MRIPFTSRLALLLTFIGFQEDEIDAWNQFVRDLKDDCHGEPGNTQFWGEVSQQGRGLSLISESEAEKLGGQSDVSDTVADKVRIFVPS